MPATNNVALRYFYNKCDMCINIFFEIVKMLNIKDKTLFLITDKVPNNYLEKELKELNISLIVMEEIVTDSIVTKSPYFFLLSNKEISNLYFPDWQNPIYIKEYLENILEQY
ncbi:MAG: hypothetical protein JJU34_01535 [Lunatimonas sp.]|uniref:hypothetical protein n=1 Tax=Lunatimonas sp. TaxID=2060141 RepID=UPI00263AC729|nr:hypothetical protein [Lunatimonas sp.]MCC5935939.1 hypothetical protein [Lunatimonas sp.]